MAVKATLILSCIFEDTDFKDENEKIENLLSGLFEATKNKNLKNWEFIKYELDKDVCRYYFTELNNKEK